ncbi:hypothetical protein P43SY_008325 [Pythium insidiosum]|uniref:CMGC/MAPK protein kinase n=1 Tax=Pythium insidiosum TaxID=114742 RepID=A0AAD5M0U5_PYTIN|nr:hypothetical protein P43SY_008325 [Pythium insidiosum]
MATSLSEEHEQELRKIFDDYDQLRDIAEDLGEPLSEVELQYLAKEFDSDQSTRASDMAKRERAAPVVHDDGFTINGCVFHVDPRYKPIDAIGQGSYGVVCSVRNTETNEKLAIKKITPMAGDEWDATHTLREIRLMRCLGAHENIISLKDLSMREDKDELYMMMELADTDLHRLIQSSCPLTEGHIRVIMFQILSGVKAMHDNGVLHRDLKPGNLLLNKDCELKITDFGLARMIPRDQQANDEVSVNAAKIVSPMTEYVVTRWYRPPELMLAPNGCYDGSVDMWSVGCILGELISRKPMFPGTDFMDQLTRVFKVVPIPVTDERGYAIEKDALKFLQSLPPTPENAMERLFKSGPPLALDLMKKLLCFNPRQRISADEALAHPFFDGVKEEWGEIAELKLGHSLEFAFEQQSLPLATLRQFICDEVRTFREREDAERKKRQAESQDEAAAAKNSSHSQAQPQALRVANDMQAGRGFSIKGCEFNVPPQYKPLQVLGEGSYGIVCAASDTTTKKNVAIKKITPMAGDEWDAKHTLREIRLMRYFGHHPNIASLQNLSTCTERDELYIMMDLVDTDLHRLIQSKTKLEDAHIAAIMYQLLCGAKVLHENGVLHRDLKPGNILVSKNCDVRITDFGLSRYIPHGGRSSATSSASATHEKGKDLMTEYVVTRWYRAPEIMLAPNGTYGEAVDMWSIGCIFGELLNRKPMFPGSDFIDQLSRVFRVLPVPTPDKRGYVVEGDALKFLESLPPCSPDSITKLFRKASPEALSLLRRLLCINPERRISAKQALAHPYFKSIRQQLGDPPEFVVARAFDFEFDYQEFPLSHLRQLIQDEVRLLQEERTSSHTSASAAVAKRETATASVNDKAVVHRATSGSAAAQAPATTTAASVMAAMPHGEAKEKQHDAPTLIANKLLQPSPISTTQQSEPSTTAPSVVGKPSESHKQQDESDSEDEKDVHLDKAVASRSDPAASDMSMKATTTAAVSEHKQQANVKEREEQPESDDDDSVVSEASSGRAQQKRDAPKAAVPVKATVSAKATSSSHATSTTTTSYLRQPQSQSSTVSQKLAAMHPQENDDDDEEDREEIIQVERARRPVSGRLERPRSATGAAAGAAAARRAAVATTSRRHDGDEPTARSNNDTGERWGHSRAATATASSSTATARPHAAVHSTSSGATAILNKRQPLYSSSSRAMPSSRSSSSTSVAASTNQQSASSASLHSSSSARDHGDDKNDAYRHPERVASSRTATNTSGTTSRGSSSHHGSSLASSASAKEILPDGWVKRIHSKSGREYYYDTLHKVSSWKHPSTSSSSASSGTSSSSAAASSRPMDNIFGSTAQPHATTARRPSLSTSSGTSLTAMATSRAEGPSSNGSKESALPKDWERRTDPKTGRLFYVNLITKKTFARLPSSVSAAMLTTTTHSIGTSSSGSSNSSSMHALAASAKLNTAAKTLVDPTLAARKKATVPQSPQFSQMSWQKKRTATTGDE